MTNWILIYLGRVVAVIEKEGNIDESDYDGVWDTITQDDSKTFQVGDEFTAELQLEYNREIWLEKGWISNPVPVELPESVKTARQALKSALLEANMDALLVRARSDNE